MLQDLHSIPDLPLWIKSYSSNYYTMARRARIDAWRVEGDIFYWQKDGTEYPIKNYREAINAVYGVWANKGIGITEASDKPVVDPMLKKGGQS